MRLAPKTAVVIRNGQEQTVSIEQVRKGGDVFVVRPVSIYPWMVLCWKEAVRLMNRRLQEKVFR